MPGLGRDTHRRLGTTVVGRGSKRSARYLAVDADAEGHHWQLD